MSFEEHQRAFEFPLLELPSNRLPIASQLPSNRLSIAFGFICLQGLRNDEVVAEVRSRLYRTRANWLLVFDNVSSSALIEEKGVLPRGCVVSSARPRTLRRALIPFLSIPCRC